jgi:hypothetical protein
MDDDPGEHEGDVALDYTTNENREQAVPINQPFQDRAPCRPPLRASAVKRFELAAR